jgi:hypothetical protein
MIDTQTDGESMSQKQCESEARYQLGGDPEWVVCEACLAGLREEEIEEAADPKPIHGVTK